jgi:hypothetical protein
MFNFFAGAICGGAIVALFGINLWAIETRKNRNALFKEVRRIIRRGPDPGQAGLEAWRQAGLPWPPPQQRSGPDY